MHTIKSARVKAKKTQREVADYLGMDVSTYNLKENHKREISLSEAFNFSVFVNVDLKDIDWFEKEND